MAKFIHARTAAETKRAASTLLGLFSLGMVVLGEPVRVVMQLDWIYNAQFAGLYQAKEQGYFSEEGLDVEIRPTDPNLRTVPAVLAEEIAFGSSESNVLLGAHAEGAPIVVLATMFQESPIGWMHLSESGIDSFTDLAGRRIGVYPDGEKIIALLADKAGVDASSMTLPTVAHDISVLTSGEVDAMQGYAIDEYVKLKIATNDKAGIIMARDYGYSAYSQVIFTSRETVERHPEVVRSFLKATKKGWIYALDNPGRTVDLILRQYNPSLDRAYQLASLNEIEKLVRPAGKEALSPIDPTVFATSQEQYLKAGILKERTDLESLLDLRFNP